MLGLILSRLHFGWFVWNSFITNVENNLVSLSKTRTSALLENRENGTSDPKEDVLWTSYAYIGLSQDVKSSQTREFFFFFFLWYVHPCIHFPEQIHKHILPPWKDNAHNRTAVLQTQMTIFKIILSGATREVTLLRLAQDKL